MNIQAIIHMVLGVITPMIPFLGSNAHSATERAFTFPEADIRKACVGMSDADINTTIDCFRKGADAFSDGICMIASRGQVKPD